MTRAQPTKHGYVDDGSRDANDHGRCTRCNLPETNQRHHFPTVPAHVQDAEDRRTGDR